MEEDRARRRLQEEQAATADRIRALQREFDAVVGAATDVATDDEHDPEGTTLAFERAGLAALLKQAQVHLAATDEALRALEAGRYDRCERCGGPIGWERLRARPVARTCVSCAARSGSASR